MKFLITGDWHIDKDKIKTRRDNVLAACTDKLGQIFQIAKSYGCKAILQPGDFFESHRAPDFLKQYVINFLKSDMANVPIFTVFGQHDLRYHSSNINNTPLKVLEASGVVSFLGEKPLVYPQDGVNIYGASWFEEIPDMWEKLSGINILVLHKMIVDSKIWEGQEDHTFGKTLVMKSNFDLIVSGDNHKHFIMHSGTGGSIGKRLLINCGSMLRTRIDQEDHRPCVYVYETHPCKGEPVIEQVYLVVPKFRNVINVEKAVKIKAENEKLIQFTDALSVDAHLTGINYKRNVYDYQRKNKKAIDAPTGRFIDLVFKKLEERYARDNKDHR
jgi:DNA repair exonuclease SbcCD nuclease subunit